MRVVSGSGDNSLPSLLDLLVPELETLVGPFIKSCEQEIGITTVRPESIEEHYDGVDPARVGVDVVHLNALITTRSPTVELLRICHHAQAVAAPRENFLRRTLAVIGRLRIARY